ncbi:NAD(P)H-dependent oxidoreductase [Aliifodinibius sp. S!AR15-10]|uniref:NADPH-dependent FMN reductase n=1 Tax=Aliifodinibius sp. S!AR15-10 TaxID=2950437 RepID=UPI002854B080|nr:NAD(P)H-dependent oxidoreductase [Aliifodinibius sp. S!AR15-10]MDR8389659.1 NAD(P)H-dependent oxidoreductase [Aliifodinibius sp. S!AR15-10]
MIELNIISGTDRPNSNALRVSKYLKEKYQEHSDVIPEIIDLRNFPLQEVSGGPYGKKLEEVDNFTQRFLDADGLCVVVPEYNGGYPGILKLMIDYLPYPSGLEKKPVCFVGEADGAFGALRAVEQLQQVFSYRNAYIFPERVHIPRVNNNFDEREGIKDSFQQQLLENQIHNFVEYISNLKGEGALEELND